MIQRVRCATAIALVVVSGQVLAESAAAWLDRMSHSFRELNYQGTFSFQQGDSIESFRIEHAVIDGEEYERLDYLDGEKRRIIRRGHSLNCIHTGQKLVRSLVSLNQANQGARIADSYALELLGDDRIAGRPVVNLSVVPKDAYRYGYLLSLDVETGLLLRSELSDSNGDVKERFQFVELEIVDDIPRQHFDQDHFDYSPRHGRGAGAEGVAPGSWHLAWVPPGFTSAAHKAPERNPGVATYTDGLAVFSVFVEPEDHPHPATAELPGIAQKGATSVYSTRVAGAQRSFRVTVVGEVPRQTVQKLAQSVTLSHQP